ncbi:hypothetical protein [Brucella intermedia]|uniref:hypothetical protein n=1 Tax=Brucella intermedia TaxID=94625 RepID=UPI00244EEE57|nr:hypothetical protein [Brucella intermedia]WGJ06614.1 hypothetical protein QBQ48_12250 [Brucella intermedia]
MSSLFKNQKTWMATKVVYRSAKETVQQQWIVWKWIITFAKSIWTQRQRIKRGEIAPPAHMPPEQQFVKMMRAFGKSLDDLPALQGQTYIGFWSSTFIAVLLTIAVTYGSFGIAIPGFAFGGLEFSVAGALRVAAPAILLLMALRQAQANWIFRNRRHGSLNDFLRSGDWLPSK